MLVFMQPSVPAFVRFLRNVVERSEVSLVRNKQEIRSIFQDDADRSKLRITRPARVVQHVSTSIAADAKRKPGDFS